MGRRLALSLAGSLDMLPLAARAIPSQQTFVYERSFHTLFSGASVRAAAVVIAALPALCTVLSRPSVLLPCSVKQPRGLLEMYNTQGCCNPTLEMKLQRDG